MTDVHKEESQKTIISFIFGLLIGGLLVWAFMGGDGAHHNDDAQKKDDPKEITSPENASSTNASEVAVAWPTGDAKIAIGDKKAGREVAIAEAVYPIEEGWIGVREYNEGKLGWINGVIRFSKAGNVQPKSIPLVVPTVAGREYAVVVFNEAGKKDFNSATDKQIDTIFTTFKAE